MHRMGVQDGPHSRDLLFGLAIGVAIAGYTLVNSEGLEHADPLPYLFVIAAVSVTLRTTGARDERQGG
jgi:hypothetical protein